MSKVAIVHNIPIHYKHSLFGALVDRGVDFTVLFMALRIKGAFALEAEKLQGARYTYRVGFQGPYEEASEAHRAQFVWRSLQSLSPSVVIISGYHAAECWVALLWAKLHNASVVLWYESNEFDKRRTRWKETLKRTFVKGCDQAHVYGTTNADYLKKLGLQEPRILFKRAVANCELFGTERNMRAYRGQGVFRLLYVGRLAPEKNLETLLRSFAKVHAVQPPGSMRLALAGSGPLEAELKRQCTELGVDKSVDFLGYHPQSALPGIFRAHDVLVLPSLVEPWGLVVNEALLCRMPVIVSRQCGCAVDLVTPRNGWLFHPAYSQAALEGAILEACVLSADRLAQMGDVGFEIGIQYSPENCAQRVIQGLQTLERKPRGPVEVLPVQPLGSDDARTS